ncbi:hypothetical protein L3X38_026026 [Prunus dulcis]|uniref:Retrotransposon Copia-like N-terminal domain-containing protein n=1 Tax=Prunus dulcis TaxID=3755 RepID=A0AAD4W4N1_PRUDU|nr:hypothetical protein L3X38_026026 [Prunus dulcis]
MKSTSSGMTSRSKWESPNHPLYLHYSDQPGAVLVPQPLVEDNYSTWVQSMTMALTTWLLGSMSKEISGSVINCKDARQMWLDLQESCDTKKEITSYVETQKTMKFLMGINDSYSTVRSNTLLLEPLPTVNKAYSLVLRHERQAEISSGKHTSPSEAAPFAVKNGGRETDGGLRCGKCNKTNHSTQNCRAHLKCTFCGWKGHSFEYCRKRKAAAEAEQSRSSTSKDAKLSFFPKRLQADARNNFLFLSKDEDSQLKAIDFGLSDFVKLGWSSKGNGVSPTVASWRRKSNGVGRWPAERGWLDMDMWHSTTFGLWPYAIR